MGGADSPLMWSFPMIAVLECIISDPMPMLFIFELFVKLSNRVTNEPKGQSPTTPKILSYTWDLGRQPSVKLPISLRCSPSDEYWRVPATLFPWSSLLNHRPLALKCFIMSAPQAAGSSGT